MEPSRADPVELRLRAAVESSPSGLLMIDAKGVIVLVNRQVETLFGYSREELLGKSVDMLVPERFRQHHSVFRSGYFADPKIRSMGHGRDLYGLRRDGTEVPVEIGLNPVITNEGMFVISSIVDISGRKQAEQRFRAAVESSPNGMIMTDAHGHIVLVNRETERLFGYTRDELLNQPIEILVPDRFRQPHPTYRDGFYRDPRSRSMGAGRDLFGLRKDGVEIPVEIGLTPIETDEGLFVLSAVVDISERKSATAALRESEERFRLLVRGVRDYAIFMLNPDGRIVSWNDGAERIIGHKEGEIVGRHFAMIYPREDAGQAATHLATARETGSLEEEGWRLRRDGTHFFANVTTTALRDDQGQLRGFAVVTRDITERRRLEDQLRQAQKMEAVGTLAGGIAHDFNNILSAIVGYGELARDQSADRPAVVEDVQELLVAADRGKKLVERILAFSRRQEPSRRPMNLGTMVDEVIKLLRATLPATIEIRPRIDPTSPRVLADATAVHQVLMNLATNAAHAMPKGGILEIGVESIYVRDSVARSNPSLHEGPYALLLARDTGGGMDPATKLRVFEPFFTTKEAGKGTGLGLAMVHTVMQEHEGAVVLESELGIGTTVKCFFPVLTSEATDVQLSATDAPRGHGERILYIDDERSLARLGERRLVALGYAAHHETDSARAVERFKKDPAAFDLIITDYTMPGMTGIDLARQVHSANPKVPIVMVTGFVEDLSPADMEAIGIRKVIRKPITIEILATAVQEVLRAGKTGS